MPPSGLGPQGRWDTPLLRPSCPREAPGPLEPRSPRPDSLAHPLSPPWEPKGQQLGCPCGLRERKREEGEQKRMLFDLKVQNLMPLFGSAKATSPFDSDESLLAAWAGGRPPGSSGEIDWKENTWLNLLPPPPPRLTWHPSTPFCRYRSSGYTDKRYPNAASTNRVTLHWVTYFT